MSAAAATRFMHSRYALFITAILFAGCAWVACEFANLPFPGGGWGIVQGWNVQWLQDDMVNLAAGVCCSLAAAFLLALLNKTFNVLKSMTMFQGTAFLFMQLAVPASIVYLNPGSLLCVVLEICLALMFLAYSDVWAQRNVFLVFCILSGCASFDINYAYFFPVFLLGCLQMRIFSLRTVLAMLMGIATPWIIMLGFGIVDFSELTLRWPWAQMGDASSLTSYQIVVIALAIFLIVSAWMQNLLKIVTYNARSRALMSMVTTTTLCSLAICAVDFSQFYAYLPLLNMCAALQLGHLFGVVHQQTKSYVAMLVLFLIYLSLYSWRIALCISL